MEVENKISVYDKFEDKTITPVNDFPAKLDNLINNIIMKERYKTYEVERKIISTNGGSYLGILYEIDVKVETMDGAKETNIFVKSAPNIDTNLTLISIYNAYKMETFAYTKLNKVYNELQDEVGIPAQERFKMIKGFDECSPEAIILDNVSRRGYKTTHRLDVVSLKYAETAIQILAKFHALSFVVKERRPDFFNENIKTAKVPWMFSEYWRSFIKSICTLTLNCLDDEMRQKMENIFPKLLDIYPRYLQDNFKFSCLCHGDYRPNNIMMKEVNGEVDDLIPIDYQIMHFGCPAHDLIYFTYMSTDKAFRKENFTYLKNFYYDALRKHLEFFDLTAEAVYPKEELEKDLEERLDYGLMALLIYGPFVFADASDIPDVSKDSMATISFKVHDIYKNRLRETVEDFIEKGFLDKYSVSTGVV